MGISILPHVILYKISDVICFLLYKVFGYRLKVVRKNLKLCFPEKSNEERLQIEKEFYKNLCDIFIEIIKSVTISKKQIMKRYKFFNAELINKFLKQNRSVILMIGHYSNWEKTLSMGLYTLEKICAAYSPLSNKYFNKLLLKSRQKSFSHMISKHEGIARKIRLHQSNNINYIYALVSDQSYPPNARTYWKSFMGIEVPVLKGGELIARKYNMPVFFSTINRVKRGYYENNVSLINDKPKNTKENEITDAYILLLEKQIKQDPSQYFWTHNRFKHMDKNPKLISKTK